ncbi:MAG: 3-oxoacyl-[acyl-carrier-protein] synthase III C-terminal domain-containing protein [Thermodesulfobacteriota bacterium]|nr:3-oxoacyl-[acyl-carrier-protein] synthase III C-terminal domain-containing protein [Thermodesulfobacteriota bacterium]
MSKSNICGIAGMGFYMPEKEIPVKKLAEQAGIPEFVVEALGAATVREAAANEYPSDMAIKAARAALEKGGIDPLDIDLIIYCGAGVPDYIIPQTAGKIQYAIGAENAFGFDLSQGCCGMLTAIQLAKGYISIDEGITNVMLVTGDKWSQFTRFHSADSVFFGDGGGAAVISRGHHELFPLSTEIITKGEFYDLWCIQAGALRYPASEATLKKDMHTYVCLDRERARHEFKELYIPGLLHVVRGALKKCSLNPSDVSYFDMVNNNLKVQKAILKELGISVDASSARYLQKFGHFGAQDIFLNLDMAVREKKIKKGDIIVMLTAGIGFSWGSAVFQY